MVAEDSDGAFDLFGPEVVSDLEVEPMSPHHNSRERTGDGVRVRVEEGRVIH